DRAELLRLRLRLRTTPARRGGDLRARVTELLDAGVRPVVVELVNSISLRLALVPPGHFLMGSPSGEPGRLDHERQHEVEITKPYWLGVFPVTQRQWRAVMRNNPSGFRAGGDRAHLVAGMKTGDFPVEQVSWDDAQAFLDRLSGLPAEKE